jgi:PhzF family phenazine biosynthesis protein
MLRSFRQVDVFAPRPYTGNPLAVVADGVGLSDDEMQRFANWTNLSETTFLLPPSDPGADYRVRIFTTTRELPFAGHPTLGSCQVWLDHGGAPKIDGQVVQECGVGLVSIRRDGPRLAFSAPSLIRSGPVDEATRSSVESVLGCEVVDCVWADNGPGWLAALLPSAQEVVDLEPDFSLAPDLTLGVVGAAVPGLDHDFEVRAFFPGPASTEEDPVTGSLNASLAQWLMGRNPTLRSYVARQGTALGRDGRVYLTRDDDDTIWVGGEVTTCVSGTVEL